MRDLFAYLGPWSWMILAAALFALEVMSPGILLMWFGVAAAATGVLAFLFTISWQWQLVWFSLLSLTAVLVALADMLHGAFVKQRALAYQRMQHIGQCYDLVD